jgi:hypothetical protein
MNNKVNAILRCNNCESILETDIWTQITTGKDTKLDNDIFQDRINFFECEACENIGPAIYPIKITDKASGDRAVVIPFMEPLDISEDEEVSAMGFSVLEVQDKKPCRIFYSFSDFKQQLCYWQGGDDTDFDPPPEERDIEEGLQRGIINKDDAAVLRNADWKELIQQMIEQTVENDGSCEFGDERDDAIDLYLKLMSALNQERKVVPLRP